MDKEEKFKRRKELLDEFYKILKDNKDGINTVDNSGNFSTRESDISEDN